MFFERKFLSPTERATRLGDTDARLAGLPEPVRDVVRNLDRLLAAQRGISHVLPDYGLSHAGQGSVEGLIVTLTAELRETLPRYEPRLALDDIQSEIDDDGRPLLLVLGRVGDTRVTLTIDPLRHPLRHPPGRRVHAVHLG